MVSDFDPQRLLASLNEAGAQHVVVGAIALIAHGVVRATLDLDIVPDPAAANLHRLATAIRALDGAPAGEPGTPVDEALLAREANMRFDTVAGQLDVLLGTVYRRMYPDLRSHAQTVDLDGVRIVVASRNDLVRLKAGSGRNRDLLDIGDLLALDE